ncbi:MAG: ribosome small subunit-dependent GTPase A [Bacteroidota bacterium]|nr:ribosome small subunit-dependent GTPase A [Bacteroidota bacterium]
MINGVVYRSTGSWYDVKLEDGTFIKSRIKGKFRTKGLRTTNPLAVGDYVHLIKNDVGEYIVDEIQERKNYIIRKSVNLSKEAHIIASNIDLAVLLVTISNPATATGFIDRFTVTAEAYHIPLHIVFNKIDLYDDRDKKTLHEWESTYSKANYNNLCISAKTGEGLNKLSALIADKTTLIAGNSGAGKSTLINQIIPNLALKTGNISTTHMTGKHTTTFAEMFDVNENTRIIDTPGIKGFGLVDFKKEELGMYFPEMMALLDQCKFHNCKHINEPGCEVLNQLKQGNLSISRYQSYLSMYQDDPENNYRQNMYS